MNNVKLAVRLFISLMFLCSVVSGQLLTRRKTILQRQQNELNQQQELLEKQLVSQGNLSGAKDQNSSPINHAVLDSIFNVPIQAIKAVSELVRTLAEVRARISPNTGRAANLVESKDVDVMV